MKFRRSLSVLLSVIMAGSAVVTTGAVTSESLASGYTNQTDSYATYSGGDLGATYSKASTTFKVWAPSASSVKLKMYKTGSDSEEGAGELATQDMSKDSSTGVWSVTVSGDLNGVYYTYLVTVNGKTNETQDVYSTATGVNGNRSMVVDLDLTDPDGWSSDKHVLYGEQTDANIWEVQVRDFSISDTSGVSDAYQGKFLAFTQGGTKVNGSGDVSTCVDYLVKQGVKYVHLNPVYDYGSVDETKLDKPQYNWGYDPVNYNVPDGSYSTDPYNGAVRIKEFKQMVQALHDRGIGVIMDVVYNHTYSTASCFEKTVPGYYYRMSGSTFLNGSGCGNVTASDKAMFRKYMIDSVMYWAQEYHIDGFRFDLMGCHDVATMNQIRANLDTLDKRILMYGEPWMADWNANGITQSSACIMANADSVSERVAMFSDKIRNALKGGTDDATKGYIQGSTTVTGDIKAGMMGGSSTTFGKWAKQPSQCVTYNSAHDNLTLWDKIIKSNGSTDYDGTNAAFLAQNKLSAAIILTSQGIPFYLAGEEFARTKHGDHNSYSSSDSVNQIDWSRVSKYQNLVDYYRGLMLIRDSYSPFSDGTTASGNTTYFVENGSAIGYTIQNKTANAANEWGTVAVLTNNTSAAKSITLKGQSTLPSSWVIVANGDKAGLESLGTVSGSTISVPARSAMVLVDAASFNSKSIAEPNYYTITTKHVNKNTGEVLKTSEAVYKEGTTYRTAPDSDILFDYLLSGAADGETTGTVTGNKTITYYYVPDSVQSYTLTTKFVDGSGNSVAAEQTKKLKSGSSYTTEFEAVTGYELDTDKLPGNISGTISANTTVTYVYKKAAYDPLKIHYYNTNGWSKVCLYSYDDSGAVSKNLSGAWPGTAMTSEGSGWYVYPEIDVQSAKAMFTNGAATGALQEPGANQPGYEVRGEVWIKNGTVSFNSKVIVSYIDSTGKKLADDEIITGTKVTSADSYTTQGLSSQTATPVVIGNASGKWSVSTKNIIYIYPNGTIDPTDPTDPTDPITDPTPPYGIIIFGDVNFDETVNLRDAMTIQKIMITTGQFDSLQVMLGDVDRNGVLNLRDAIIIQRYALQLLDDTMGIGEQYREPVTDPITDPVTDPVTDPTQPTTDPTVPVTDPTQPITDPTVPVSDIITVYFSNNYRWSSVKAYIWNAASGEYESAWPGSEMTYVGNNSYGEAIYKVEVDLSKYDMIIFNNGSGYQTVDIALDKLMDSTGFHLTGESNNSMSYGTYVFNPSELS
ncbi:MAG: type I pullulanase [Acutalibacteraceae bacterium]